MALTDRYGLAISTSSAAAAERFQDGMDRLLSYGPGAEESFAAALEADDGLAVAHSGVALLAVGRGDAATARAAVGRAREAARRGLGRAHRRGDRARARPGRRARGRVPARRAPREPGR